jgi:hypothetical protein
LARYATRCPHLLIVEVRGDWELRAALQRHALRRGWRLSDNPADADVLAVCGEPGTGLTDAIATVWEQMPGPRVRCDLVGSGGDAVIDGALDRVCAQLANVDRHRHDARTRAPLPTTEAPKPHTGDMDHPGMDMGSMDMGGMDMAMSMTPSGIALAEGGSDRDGLEMDVLHLRLGPVLQYWPAGVVVGCALQGDVIVDAEAWMIDPEPEPAQARSARVQAARECDRLASLLAMGGWPHAASRARRVRDLLLATDDPALDALEALRRMVLRSWVFRWSMRGATDAHLGMLARAGALLTAPEPDLDAATTTSIEALPALVIGRDVATARLLIAGLDITAAPAARHPGDARG